MTPAAFASTDTMKRIALAIALIVASFVAGLVVTGRMRSGETSDAQSRPAPAQPATRTATTSGVPAFTEVAARTVPAVANISSAQVQRSPFTSDPFFRQFFGDDEMYGYRGVSVGSGVIVSADGYVLTNNHVVGQHMSQVSVVLNDGRERAAKLVGIDPYTDLALVKVDGQNLPVIPWGDSSRLRVAEWVLAIGNPYQLNQTVTLGIVSALGRSNVNVATYEDFIQTDAAINPGNSGGALVNERGELVGINTAIFSESGGYQGIGFAVPSNLARRVTNDLIRYGAVRRGDIGISQVAGLNDTWARELGLSDTRGVVILQMRRGAAYGAGIRRGDVIRTFNGRPIQDASEFVRLVLDAPVGSTIALGGVSADGRTFDVKVPVVQAGAGRTRM
jgi:serine protease Do